MELTRLMMSPSVCCCNTPFFSRFRVVEVGGAISSFIYVDYAAAMCLISPPPFLSVCLPNFDRSSRPAPFPSYLT